MTLLLTSADGTMVRQACGARKLAILRGIMRRSFWILMTTILKPCFVAKRPWVGARIGELVRGLFLSSAKVADPLGYSTLRVLSVPLLQTSRRAGCPANSRLAVHR